jgi:hypothetical protein
MEATTMEASVEAPTGSSKSVDTTYLTLEPTETTGLKDETIVWIVLASIVLSSMVDHWRKILENQFPASVVMAWMLVAFGVGQKIDPEILSNFLETKVLGITTKASDDAGRVPADVPQNVPDMPAEIQVVGFWQGMVRQQSAKRPRLPVAFTSLNRGRKRDSQQQPQVSKFTINRNLMKRLPMFRRKSRSPAPKATTTPVSFSEPTAPTSSNVMGIFDLNDTNADSLVDQVTDPLFELRGMDIFLTDCAEETMMTHPFLLK